MKTACKIIKNCIEQAEDICDPQFAEIVEISQNLAEKHKENEDVQQNAKEIMNIVELSNVLKECES